MKYISRFIRFIFFVIFDLHSPSLFGMGIPKKEHKWHILTGKVGGYDNFFKN